MHLYNWKQDKNVLADEKMMRSLLQTGRIEWQCQDEMYSDSNCRTDNAG